MESTVLGLILDTSIVIAGERRGLSVPRILAQVRQNWGETEIGLSAVTIAELTHGIQRARVDAQRARQKAFVDEVIATDQGSCDQHSDSATGRGDRRSGSCAGPDTAL